MESNLGRIQPQRIPSVRSTREKRERKRESPSDKRFELEGEESKPAKPPARDETADRGTVSERQEGEAGGTLDLTA